MMTRDDNADVAEGGDARSGAGRVFTPVRPSSDAGHRPAVDTPLELVIRLSAKVLETGLYGMGGGVTRWYDRLAKTGSDLHV